MYIGNHVVRCDAIGQVTYDTSYVKNLVFHYLRAKRGRHLSNSILPKKIGCCPVGKVPRLGALSPIERLFTIGSFLNTKVSQISEVNLRITMKK
jgi:hypothetical protein